MNVSASDPDLVPAREAASSEGILSPTYRAATIGMVALISLIAFEALAVTTAMPTVARELDGLKLYALAFGSVLATSVIGMTLSGRWSDRRGPAPAIWSGLVAFVAGLLIAGFAQNMPTLLVGRLVQGFGAGCLYPALYVIVGRLYPDTLRPKVFASFSAGWVVPALIGPAISGAVVEHVGWRWVFLAVPILAVPAALALRGALASLAPPTHTPAEQPGRMLNAVGASIGACLLFVAGQETGWLTVAILVPALAFLVGCGRQLLPKGTLRGSRGLPSVIALRGIIASAFFGTEAFLPLVLSHEHGMSPLWAGLAISGGALGWFAGSWYQGHYATITRQAIIHRGTVAMLVGTIVAALGTFAWMPVAASIAGWALSGLGMGMTYATVSVSTLAMSSAEEQGTNSSALQLCESLTVSTTLALGGSLFAALLALSYTAAFSANFAITASLALLGAVVAYRTNVPN